MGRRRLVAVLGLCCSLSCASREAPPTAEPGQPARAASPTGSTRALSPADAALAAAFAARFERAGTTALWAVHLLRLDPRDRRAGGASRDLGESGAPVPDPVVLASLDADRLVIPASNMKIVTLAAAALRLGWDYRFRTQVIATGQLDGHILRGDLVVVGGADPTIGRSDDPLATFRAWAQQLRARGVRRIDGDLVGDASRFGEEWLGDSWSWDDLPAGYAAAYSGLIFNENVVRIRVAPGATEGAPASITASPVAYGLHLNPAATTTSAGGAVTASVTRGLGSSIIDVAGTIPLGSTPLERTVSVSDPPRYFLGALRAALAEAGIEIRGRTRVEPTTAIGTVVIDHQSAPLAEIAQRFMKVSQNLYGEVLLRVLTASSPAPPLTPASPATPPSSAAPASPANARQALADALSALGVPVGSVQGLDGSGLSRRDFATVRAVTTLLLAMAEPDHRLAFRATLPVAGRDGTIATRFKDGPCVDRLIAKTGSLAHVRALSGYVTSASGAEYVFAVIANNYLVPTREIDGLVEEALGLVCAS